jgi:hypothetical protein
MQPPSEVLLVYELWQALLKILQIKIVDIDCIHIEFSHASMSAATRGSETSEGADATLLRVTATAPL